jgi:U11/U12 small nuclear ribonucleoprotein SNRNP20
MVNHGQTIYPPDLLQWFDAQKKQVGAQMTQKIKLQDSKKRYKLPAGWKVRELPPSLKPPPSKHGYDWTDDVGFWG